VAKAASVAASTALTSQVVTGSFDAGSFRKGEEKDRVGTTINLTVTGAFDKEGTARTIVETLKILVTTRHRRCGRIGCNLR
jgi:hypothetical protein